MSDTPTSSVSTTPLPSMKGVKGFQPGHPRYGGRKKGQIYKRTATARETAERIGFDLVEFLSRVAAEGVMPNPDGSVTPCDPAQRLDAAKALGPYLLPKLGALAIVKPEDERDNQTTVDINRMMDDPKLVEAAQTLALAASEAPQIEAPESVELTPEVLDGFEDD